MSWEFTLEFFEISETRAVHKDTDYVAVTINVNGVVEGPQVKSMGSINNGDYPVGLSYAINSINPQDQISFCYLILNHGGDHAADVEGYAAGAIGLSTLSAFDPGDALPSGGTLTCLLNPDRSEDFMNLKWLVVKPNLRDLHNDRCDGPVVIDAFSFFGSDVALIEGRRTFSYAGIHSAVGCGKNSRYRVIWSLLEIVPPPIQ
jgi:hypothetical protein